MFFTEQTFVRCMDCHSECPVSMAFILLEDGKLGLTLFAACTTCRKQKNDTRSLRVRVVMKPDVLYAAYKQGLPALESVNRR